MDKKTDILSEIWLGNICPKYDYIENERKSNLSNEVDRLHYEISESLKGELFDKFTNYESVYVRLVSEAELVAFKKGFSLAVKILSEAYSQK